MANNSKNNLDTIVEMSKQFDQSGGKKKSFTYMANIVINVLKSKLIGNIVKGVLNFTGELLVKILPVVAKMFVFKNKKGVEVNIFPEDHVQLYSTMAGSVVKNLGSVLKYHITPKDKRKDLPLDIKLSIKKMQTEIIDAAEKFKSVQSGGEIVIKTDLEQVQLNSQPILYNLNKLLSGGMPSNTDTMGDTEILNNIFELNTETVTDSVVNDMIGGTKNNSMQVVSLNKSIFTNNLNYGTDTDTLINNIIQHSM